MRITLLTPDGALAPLSSLEGCFSHLADGAFVWVDAVDPTPEEMGSVQHEFNLHPLATDDALDAHQRGKIDAYEDFWFIVAHAFTPDEGDDLASTEVAIFAGERFAVTIRHEPAWKMDEVERRWKTLKSMRRDSGSFVYTILDTIVDGYLPFVIDFEARLDGIETQLLAETAAPSKSNDILSSILSVKSSLQVMRHVVSPMQDVIARIVRGDIEIFGHDEMVYYRDVGSHVKRVLNRIDGLNDMVTTSLSLNVAIASNRHAEISRQLTIIATIFLPLTFITGFFGQNFGYLVDHITSASAFWFWGIGTEVAAVTVLFLYFLRRHWL
jgi:magnesium transporter